VHKEGKEEIGKGKQKIEIPSSHFQRSNVHKEGKQKIEIPNSHFPVPIFNVPTC